MSLLYDVFQCRRFHNTLAVEIIILYKFLIFLYQSTYTFTLYVRHSLHNRLTNL